MKTLTLTFSSPDLPTAVELMGLTRIDTEEELTLPVPPDFTDEGGGVWSIEFDEPAANLSYAYTAEVTWDDNTTSPLSGVLEDEAALSGVYWSYTGIKNILGKINAEVSSQLDQLVTTPDLERIEYDGTIADAETNRRARIANYATPIPPTSKDFVLVQQATDLYASWLLVQHREWFKNVGKLTDEQRAGLEKRYLDAYRRLFGPDDVGLDAEEVEDETPDVGMFQSVPFERDSEGCTADEYASD
jgi:hypothetical protein